MFYCKARQVSASALVLEGRDKAVQKSKIAYPTLLPWPLDVLAKGVLPPPGLPGLCWLSWGLLGANEAGVGS